MNIFISYTTRDVYVTKAFLKKIETFFSNYGKVYIDILHNQSEDKQHYVEEQLKNSDILFILETKSINQSDWVKRELLLARQLNIPIISLKFHS
ncbi:toll/interleukin-1 receptor domain-containing protein [Acinetobacter bereziniae]|uniref:toll/interleukin-1 receptor domain-containing protein n=1 Tax=Acinetobacter bereziniae TaxID=106648 RepID=UPI000C2BB18F|nr:hypothetical protein BSR55_18425 [Acinetobacter bereziniae]